MTFPPNTTALDADVDMTRVHAQLVAQGFDTIIRYTTPGRGNPEKQASVAEAKSQQQHGLKLALVHETTADRALGGAVAGEIDGTTAAAFAAKVGLPPNNGSVLFASTDFDVTGSHAAAVKAYVQAFAKAAPGYGVGLYGNGFINDMLFDAKIIQVRWITQSMGFTGTRSSLEALRYEIVQRLPAKVCGLDVDPDSLRVAGADIGARIPFAPVVKQPETLEQRVEDFFTGRKS